MSSSQLVVNFKGADYQLFNGAIVKRVSKGVHNLTITHSNFSRNSLLWDFYLLEHRFLQYHLLPFLIIVSLYKSPDYLPKLYSLFTIPLKVFIPIISIKISIICVISKHRIYRSFMPCNFLTQKLLDGCFLL